MKAVHNLTFPCFTLWVETDYSEVVSDSFNGCFSKKQEALITKFCNESERTI